MLHINNLTYRIEGRPIFESATAGIPAGHKVGLVGRNGAGKTTLLKLISRVTWPTSGKVRVAGRAVSLIELGAGFHPELTGRENVYLGAGREFSTFW